jgi:tetratricopeptide (TPR) repeat protein
MGETTTQPTNRATGQPVDKPTDHSQKKTRDTSTWIALASAATAIVAAAISGFQVNLASRQNTVAEQQQLVNLTTLIEQQLTRQGTITTTPKGLAGTAVAARTGQGAFAQIGVEGQAAAVLIRSLHGAGVAGMEYIEVARALDTSGDTRDAITYYKDALTAPPNDPTTHAIALNFLGGIYYGLGRNVIAHQYFMRAAKAFAGHILMRRAYVAQNAAAQYLTDANFQIYIKGCRIAKADMTAAKRTLGSYTPTTADQEFMDLYRQNYPRYCNGTG